MRKTVFCFLFAAAMWPAYSAEVSIAPFIINTADSSIELSADDKDVNGIFQRMLESQNASPRLRFKNLGSSGLLKGKPVQSSLDASQLCEAYGLDFLVYGFYRRSHAFYEMEIRLYDREGRNIAKTFYAKAEIADREAMILDLAGKLLGYLYKAWGVSPEETAKQDSVTAKELGGLQMCFELGYWTPVGDWFGVYTGIVKAGGGLLVQPEDIFFYFDDFPVCFRFGILFDYSLGLSKPEIETSSLHTLQLQIPGEFLIYFRKQHCGYAGITLYYVHDIIYQVRLFGSPVVGNSGTFGAGVKIGYEYWVGETHDYSFGVELVGSCDFFSVPRFDTSLTFQFKYRFPFESEKR